MHIKSIIFNDRCYLNVGTSKAANTLPTAVVLNAVVKQLESQIDSAAGQARTAFASPSSYIDYGSRFKPPLAKVLAR